jgi:adenylate cyclase
MVRIDPSPVFTWALDPARDIDEEGALIDGLVGLLAGAGLQMFRLAISFRPIDPQVWARAVLWERGLVTIHDRTRDIRLAADYLGSVVQAIHEGSEPIRERLDPAKPSRYPLLADLSRRGATDYLIQPVILNRTIRTFVAYATDRAGGYTSDELAFLHEIYPAVSSLVRLRSTRLTVGSLARTYLGPNAAERVLAGGVERGQGERIQAAIWFCDLRDFTVLTDALPPDQLVRVLDMYFESVAGPVADHGGEVLKFIGDAMLAIFPCEAQGARDACARATAAALDALEHFDSEVAVRCRTELGLELGFGVSLHLGDVFYGNIGARDRLDFTVIGSAVNLAARVQGQCSSLGTPLLMTQTFVDQISRDDLHPLGARPLKGVAAPPPLVTLARFVR